MRRHSFILTSVVTVAAVAVLAAGCGGKSSLGVAHNASSTTATTSATQAQLLAFSTCMRSHGMTNFPDPQNFANGNVKLTINRLGLSGPRFQTAIDACSHLLPSGPRGTQLTAQQQRSQLAGELSFARCMRSHGLAGFPDPNGQGQLSVAMVQAAGIDVHSAAVLRVVQTCLPASHGWLTAAKVRDSIAHTP